MEVSNEKLEEIAEQLDTGFKVFLNAKSLEIVSFPDADKFNEIDPIWKHEIDKVYNDFENYIEIEGLDSSGSFKIMESFIRTITDKNIIASLTQAIEGHKPFANFKYQIDNSPANRHTWFEFKQNQLIEYVRKQLNF